MESSLPSSVDEISVEQMSRAVNPLIQHSLETSRSKVRKPAGVKWDVGVVLLAAVILLTILEGAARKWLFYERPPLRYAAYFSKDVVLLLVACLGLVRRRQFDLTWMAPCALLILLPSAPATMAQSNFVGIALSLRAYLVIPACAFLVVPLIRNFASVERCAMIVGVIAVPVAGLGTYQYYLPASHVLNRYDATSEDVIITGAAGHVRATGTFSYIGGMSTMAGLAAWAGMFLVFPVSGRSNRIRILGAAALAAGLVCAAVSMSRTALIIWCATVIGGLALYLRASQVIVGALSILAVGLGIVCFDPGEDADELVQSESIASGMIYRIRYTDSFYERGMYFLSDLVGGVMNHPLGEGLGVGQPGGAYASGSARRWLGYESEWGRIAYEVGPLGLLGVMLFRVVVGVICWRALRSTKDVYRRLVLATSLPLYCIMLLLGSMAFNHVGNSAVWAVMALALSAVPSINPSLTLRRRTS